MPDFGPSSRRKLDTCHPVLQELCQRVVKHHDITILVGHRTETEQTDAFKKGNSTKQWPQSKHNSYPSMAVDVAPYPIPEGWGDLKGQTTKTRDLDWKERVKFYEVIALFRFTWSQMCKNFPDIEANFDLRLGADWDGDGDYRDQTFDDLPHIELIEV
ncbi:MAG: M15 family peptidase [Gammaproteobacteria bacterium]|nr:M15 family peptidase [Gammaproteobacteria bacterium]